MFLIPRKGAKTQSYIAESIATPLIFFEVILAQHCSGVS